MEDGINIYCAKCGETHTFKPNEIEQLLYVLQALQQDTTFTPIEDKAGLSEQICLRDTLEWTDVEMYGEYVMDLEGARRDAQPKPTRMHTLKVDPEQFECLQSGVKTFELRVHDRDYQVGDALHLRCFDRIKESYDGRDLWRTVSHMISGRVYGLPPHLCILSLDPYSDELYLGNLEYEGELREVAPLPRATHAEGGS